MRFCIVSFVYSVCCLSVVGAVALEEGVELETRPMEIGRTTESVAVGGVIRDSGGAPLRGVAVRWWERERPEGLQRTGAPDLLTDEDGRFTLPLPRDDVWYSVHLERFGFRTKEVYVMGTTPLLEVTLARTDLSDETISGTVTFEGTPTRATVYLIDDRGRDVFSLETGDDGRFSFNGFPKDYRPPSVYATAGGRFSRILSDPQRKTGWNLELGEPGSLSGEVLSAVTREPISGCSIGLLPFGDEAPIYTTSTDSSGRFVAPALPPDSYEVAISHPAYVEPSEATGRPDRSTVGVKAGESVTYQAYVFPVARLSGRVVSAAGAPVAGAWVGAQPRVSHGGGGTWPDGRQSLQLVAPVQTDAEGRFNLVPSISNATLSLQAYHPEEGLVKTEVHVPAPGEENSVIVLALSGSIRVAGRVVGPRGEGVAGVAVGMIKTDTAGSFDSGLVALPALEKELLAIDFLTPRPDSEPGEGRGADYYLSRSVSFAPVRGHLTTLEVTLKPTRVITLSGHVRDEDSVPVSGVEITVLPGEGGQQYLPTLPAQAVRLKPKSRPAGSLLQDLRRYGTIAQPVPEAHTTSDADGAWTLRFVAESIQSLRARYRGTGATLGARLHALHVERGLELNLDLDYLALLADSTPLDLVFKAGAPVDATGELFHARVVDTNGEPLSGIEWQWGRWDELKTAVTDAEGNLHLPRDVRAPIFKLVNDRWTIVDPSWSEDNMTLRMKGFTGPQPYPIVLGQRSTLTVRTFYPDGTPAPVRALLGIMQDSVTQVYTDDGSVLNNIPSGRHRIELDAPDGYSREIAVEIPSGRATEMTIEVPRATCAVTGQVMDIHETPQGEIELTLEGADYRKHVRSEADGRFSFQAPPGLYTLLAARANIPCLATAYNEVIEVIEGAERLELGLTVTASGAPVGESNRALPGRVTVQALSKGKPLAGLKVSARPQSRAALTLTGITDQTGYASFDHVSPGLYWLTLLRGDAFGTKREFALPVEPGGDRRFVLTLDEGHAVSGSVSGARENERVYIHLTSLPQGVWFQARVKADGSFSISDVPAGLAVLRYVDSGGPMQEASRILVGEHTEPLHVDIAARTP